MRREEEGEQKERERELLRALQKGLRKTRPASEEFIPSLMHAKSRGIYFTVLSLSPPPLSLSLSFFFFLTYLYSGKSIPRSIGNASVSSVARFLDDLLPVFFIGDAIHPDDARAFFSSHYERRTR